MEHNINADAAAQGGWTVEQPGRTTDDSLILSAPHSTPPVPPDKPDDPAEPDAGVDPEAPDELPESDEIDKSEPRK
jgi:hypothetical protein